MSITYSDWTRHAPKDRARDHSGPRTGMGAMLYERGVREEKSLRQLLPSIAVSLLAHAAAAYVLIFVSLTAMKKDEVQTINVSIAAPDVAPPAPPPLPKLERLPNVTQPSVTQIAPPQIEIAAPPSQMAIQAAPPSPPVPLQPDNAKPAEVAAVSPPRFDAAYLNNPSPVYPNMSRRLREVGTAVLRVRVNTAGQPLEIQLSKSSGYARLDEAAQAAVKKWKFQPAMRSGAAVEAWVLVPVEFSLGRS